MEKILISTNTIRKALVDRMAACMNEFATIVSDYYEHVQDGRVKAARGECIFYNKERRFSQYSFNLMQGMLCTLKEFEDENRICTTIEELCERTNDVPTAKVQCFKALIMCPEIPHNQKEYFFEELMYISANPEKE